VYFKDVVLKIVYLVKNSSSAMRKALYFKMIM